MRIADLKTSTGGFLDFGKLFKGIYGQQKIDRATVVIADQINSIIRFHASYYTYIASEKSDILYRKNAFHEALHYEVEPGNHYSARVKEKNQAEHEKREGKTNGNYIKKR